MEQDADLDAHAASYEGAQWSGRGTTASASRAVEVGEEEMWTSDMLDRSYCNAVVEEEEQKLSA